MIEGSGHDYSINVSYTKDFTGISALTSDRSDVSADISHEMGRGMRGETKIIQSFYKESSGLFGTIEETFALNVNVQSK